MILITARVGTAGYLRNKMASCQTNDNILLPTTFSYMQLFVINKINYDERVEYAEGSGQRETWASLWSVM